MQDAKTEITNNIVMSMIEDMDQQMLKKLEAVIYLNLEKYELQKKSTELAIYQGDLTEELLKRFIVAKKLKNCSDRTLRYYKQEVEKAFESMEKTPLEVSVDDIRMHFLRRQMKDGASATTINNERRCLSSFFSWMTAEEIRLQNPMLKIDILKEKRKKKVAFTELELETMRSRIDDEKGKALFEVLVSTWARVSEVAQIKISEIEKDQILVHGKGNKDRYVFLTPRAQIAIKDYLEKRTDNNQYLFPRRAERYTKIRKKDWWKQKDLVEEDGHMNTSSIESYVRYLGRKDGIKAHPHKFRRTGATMALKRGMPLMQVSKTLGHESVETTQVYLDIDDTELKSAHMKYC